MHWSARYVGLPWQCMGRSRAGIDCWGLVWLAFRECLSVELPSYEENYASLVERRELAALLSSEAGRGSWQPIDAGDERDFDVATFRQGRLESHVGLIVGRGSMLNITETTLSHIARIDAGYWQPRLIGVFRYAGVKT